MKNLAYRMIQAGLRYGWIGARNTALNPGGGALTNGYLRPGGVDEYRRPNGTDQYLRP